jgi:hypothetical protein
MNTFARFVSAAAVLGTAFFVSGCVSSSRTSRVKVVEEFAVVESSTAKELTPAQIADLRQAVANYLRGEGLTDGRTYYVKVTFPSEVPGEEPQWAVVRIGGQSARTYTVIAAYPGRDDYYPYDFYSTAYSSSYYPGYAGFSRWGYYDPFDYNYGTYHRPVTPRDHDHNKNDKPDHPDNKSDHPTSTRNRWSNPPGNDGSQPRTNYPPHQADPTRWARERAEARDAQSHPTTRPERTYNPPDRSYTPPERTYTPPERSYSPPPDRSYSPPPERSSPPSDNSTRTIEPARGGIQESREQER